MRKNVRITVISNDKKTVYETKAIISDNSIIYIEKDNKNTKVNFNYDKKQLIRENQELSMQYNFLSNEKTNGYLKIHELNKTVQVEIKTEIITCTKHNIRVKFTVESEPIEYLIEVIE